MHYSKEILEIAKQLGYEPKDVAEARALPAAELEALTNAYVQEVDQSPSYWRLMPARDLAAHYLISVFERENPFKPNDPSSFLQESPASRALTLLKKGVHPRLKELLLGWLARGDKKVFRVIDYHLVAFGSDDLLPAVEVLFEHEDVSISGGARSGALAAIKEGRAEPAFRKYVWEHSIKLLHSKKPPSMYDPIRLLEALDEDATREILLSPEVMHREHALLPEALSALNHLKRPPDAAFLNALLADDALQPPHRKERIRRAAIIGLIIQKHPSASEHVENVLREPEEYRDGEVLAAWQARFHFRGIVWLLDSAFEAYKKADFKLEPLSQDERDLVLIHYLDAEVRNGGFWQWYFNDFGLHAVETKRALEKIGATEHAKLVDQANRLFGRSGPPETRKKIQEALEIMSSKKAQKMGELTHAWCELTTWLSNAGAWDWNRQTNSAKPLNQ